MKMVNQLGTPQDSQQHKAKLHEIEHYTKRLAKDTSSNLKELSAINFPSSPSDERQRKMQKERLTDEFMTALNSFQKTQRWAAQKEKEEVQKVRANSGFGDPFGSASKKGEQLIELTDQRERQQAQLQEELDIQALEIQEEAIRQLEWINGVKESTLNVSWRSLCLELVKNSVELPSVEEYIGKIVDLAKAVGGEGFDDMQEKEVEELLESHQKELMEEELLDLSDISDVNQIFKDLGALVHEQGEIVDSIEANVEKSEIFVSQGSTELRHASEYQTKARKKKFILFLCLGIVLAIIIGIIAWEAN
ncbi:hypothetical protein J437_LFUL017074 [Ladona fulva]|uniref:t-SNARE coiled-coil homology domain-containing protein n=1 Tax=Ladona fulva TaxID=123851 RepID=A0A8K0P5P3_LADFU|nr:hypothetical protein J437_LFUL017074 [Ladona fulva]